MTKVQWEQWLTRKRVEHGDKFVPPTNAELLAPYLHTGQRVEVVMHDTVQRGFIGITTGWKPIFILLRTKRSTGSWMTLGGNVRIVNQLSY